MRSVEVGGGGEDDEVDSVVCNGVCEGIVGLYAEIVLDIPARLGAAGGDAVEFESVG